MSDKKVLLSVDGRTCYQVSDWEYVYIEDLTVEELIAIRDFASRYLAKLDPSGEWLVGNNPAGTLRDPKLIDVRNANEVDWQNFSRDELLVPCGFKVVRSEEEEQLRYRVALRNGFLQKP